MSQNKRESIKVVVRIRPMSSKELSNGNQIAAEANKEECSITLRNPKEPKEPPRTFTFDAVFCPNDTQKYIYDVCASEMVDNVLKGFNGTFFCYGQTGSGKTFTMEGIPEKAEHRGIIPHSFQHIFDHVGKASNLEFLVHASYLEIYNEEIRDLLSKDVTKRLDLREDSDRGVYVKDLTTTVVRNIAEIDHVMQIGKKNRSVGATAMNATSSRSHSIFTVTIECSEAGKIRVGKLNLVDLAGSERQDKTHAEGDRLKEAVNINLSLTNLGIVINALVDGKSTHIPYRDSKLTRLLQNSLGGNAKTVMCANCGPADYNSAETLTTLRYADRAKNIKNKPRINEDPKDTLLREFQEEIKRLKEQLESTNRGMVIDGDGNEHRPFNAKQEIIEKIVEREVIKEVHVGVSEAEMEMIHKKADEEKQILMKQAQDDMKQLIAAQSRTAQEASELQALLDREAQDKKKLKDQQKALMQKLKSAEEKVLHGGELSKKMTEQEKQLEKAQKELRSHTEQQAKLARELAEKEEANLQLEEHFSSLQEEVEAKTKKIKKLLTKYQTACRDIEDLREEFQNQRTDMLETIRQLTRAVQIHDTVIANFIPEEYAKSIEKRAVWNEEEEIWTIQKLELSGNKAKLIQRPSLSTKQRRPETDFARQKKQNDMNPRYRGENILQMELDVPERTTQDFEGPGMVSRLDNILRMPIEWNEEDEIQFSSNTSESIGNPYLQYGEDLRSSIDIRASSNATVQEKVRPKSSKKSSKTSSSESNNHNSINKTSSMSKRRSESGELDDALNRSLNSNIGRASYEEQYPTAKGLVRK